MPETIIEKEPSRLVQDDEGHWYIISIDKLTKFYDWLNFIYDGKYEGEDFSQYAIAGVHLLTLYDWEIE